MRLTQKQIENWRNYLNSGIWGMLGPLPDSDIEKISEIIQRRINTADAEKEGAK